MFKTYTNRLIVLIVLLNIGFPKNSNSQKIQRKSKVVAVMQPQKDTSRDRITFLILKIAKDSITGRDTLILSDKIEKKGKVKSQSYTPGLARFPYLSVVFYKNNVPIDSTRQSYPLRERIQNTRSNAQGYEDVEKGAMEFFMRLPQNEADRISFFKITYTENIKLLTVDL